MELSRLLTPHGLIEAIKLHHKNLHENHGFPPLSGMKPVHRLAEVFDLKSAEQFTARLEVIATSAPKASTPNIDVVPDATVNLMLNGHSELVVCYFEPEDNTLRVQRQDESAFIMVTMEEGMSSAPSVHYLDNHIALVTYKKEQVIITLEDDGIQAKLIEFDAQSKANPLCTMNALIDNSNEESVIVVDEQPDFLTSKDAVKARNVYIEDVSPKDLKTLILSHDKFKFKHKDCSMYFTSDGDNLYAYDIDWRKSIKEPTNDCFHDGNFAQTIYAYYKDYDQVIALLVSLSSVGMKLSLSDNINNHDMGLKELQLNALEQTTNNQAPKESYVVEMSDRGSTEPTSTYEKALSDVKTILLEDINKMYDPEEILDELNVDYTDVTDLDSLVTLSINKLDQPELSKLHFMTAGRCEFFKIKRNGKECSGTKAPATKQRQEVFICVKKQQGRVYTYTESSYPEALKSLAQDLMEDVGSCSTHEEVLDELGVDYSQADDVSELFESTINKLDETGLNKIFESIHEADSFIQINSSSIA